MFLLDIIFYLLCQTANPFKNLLMETIWWLKQRQSPGPRRERAHPHAGPHALLPHGPQVCLQRRSELILTIGLQTVHPSTIDPL
jgi:hypothetical protein